MVFGGGDSVLDVITKAFFKADGFNLDGSPMPTRLPLLPLILNQHYQLSLQPTFADEYGRPFIILKEQQAKARVKGLEAVKVSPLHCKV